MVDHFLLFQCGYGILIIFLIMEKEELSTIPGTILEQSLAHAVL